MTAVTISLGSFYSWLETSAGAEKLSEFILSKAELVDGFEVALRWEELESFTESVEQGFFGLPAYCHRLSSSAQRAIRSRPKLSFHLSDAKDLGFDHENWAALLLGRLHRVFRHATFVIHPDETPSSTFNRLTSEITDPWIVTVENMCPRKNSHLTLSEMSNLLRSETRLGLTFDVCHWIETGGDYSGAELRQFFTEFGSRTRSLHISVPKSQFDGYKCSVEGLSHHLCSRSGISIDLLLASILDYLPDSLSLVIEGYVPSGCEELVLEEVSYLNKWSERSRELRKRAAA